MSPPASSEEKRIGISRSRIENLSDLIFGLALSVSALSLLSKPPNTPADVRADIFAFAFSFLVLMSVWASYTRIMSALPIETSGTLLLNVLMLFLVVVEPYLLYLVDQFGDVARYQLVDYASVIYAIDMGGLMAILAFFNHQLSTEEKKLVPREMLARLRRARNILLISTAWFFLTALPQFWSLQIEGMPARFYLWFGPMAIAWISRGASARSGATPNPGERQAE